MTLFGRISTDRARALTSLFVDGPIIGTALGLGLSAQRGGPSCVRRGRLLSLSGVGVVLRRAGRGRGGCDLLLSHPHHLSLNRQRHGRLVGRHRRRRRRWRRRNLICDLVCDFVKEKLRSLVRVCRRRDRDLHLHAASAVTGSAASPAAATRRDACAAAP